MSTWNRNELARDIPDLASAGFRLAQWLATQTMGARGLSSSRLGLCRSALAEARERLARGETLYLAGLGAPGTHNSGVALVEVTQANGPRLILNNEEERFSGNKHTTEYPRKSIDAMVAALRGMGRDIGDIFAWLTSWDYPALAGTLFRSVLEEAPQSLKLVRNTEAAGFDGRRLDQMTRTPKILARQLGLSGRVPLIAMPHHDNHAWFSFAASPFADDGEPVAIAVLDGTGDLGSISLYVVQSGAMQKLYCNDSMFDSLGAFYSVISSTQGGWTWLSSEGRYMGAAAWGDMNRASNRYYARLKQVLQFGDGGEVRLNRAMANWYADPFQHPYKQALIDIWASRCRPEQLWNPDAVLRVEDIKHRPDTQDRLDKAAATQLVFEDAMIHVVDHLFRVDRREPPGADRRRRTERGRQHAPARTFRRGVVCERTSSAKRACISGCRRCRAIPASPSARPGCSRIWPARRAARPMTHAFYCGLPPAQSEIAGRTQGGRHRLAAHRRYLDAMPAATPSPI